MKMYKMPNLNFLTFRNSIYNYTLDFVVGRLFAYLSTTMPIVTYFFKAFHDALKTGGSVLDAIAACKNAKETIATINRDTALEISTVYIAQCDAYDEIFRVFLTVQDQL